MAWQILTEIAGISISYLNGITTPPSSNVDGNVMVLGANPSAWARGDASPKNWNIDNKLNISVTVNNNTRNIIVTDLVHSTTLLNATGSGSTAIQKADACFWIDDVNQYACVCACYGTQYNNVWVDGRSANSTTLYQIIKDLIPPSYNWQSVPSISGKNGILSLVTLDSESINDGEPVSGAAVSVFDQAPSNGNNIKNLADTYGGGEESSAVDVTVKYKVTLPPGGSFSTLKIVAKKDSIPEDASDGDKIVDISPSKTKKTVTGLDENSLYYFKIFGEDTNSNTSESDEKHITTSGDEGWVFDYTGQIQTFTAPKTGIYSLETWGAQGGNASDGTNSARGGYGAYAYGEVLLTQGDTLYINVGGQNGYGGGGNLVTNIINIIENNTYNPDATPQGINITNNVATYAISSGSGSWTLVNSQLSEYLLTNKTLICYMSGNIRYALTSDGIFRRSSNRSSMATHTFIPVNRQINLQKLHFKHKDYSRYGDYFQGTVGVGYVENGEFKMGATMDLDLRSTTVSDWTSKEIDLSSVPYIDYIYIVWYDGCEDFKDFEIEYI